MLKYYNPFVVQWIEHEFAELKMQVRFLPWGQKIVQKRMAP